MAGGDGRGGPPGRRLGRLDDALAILADSGARLSQEQLLDALWLATRLPPGAAGAGAPLERARTDGRADTADMSDTPARPPGPAERPSPSVPAATPPPPGASGSPAESPTPSRRGGPRGDGGGLYGAVEAPADPGAPPPPATRRALPLRVPEAKALPAELPIGRALRPLKQRRPNPLKREVDEVATATALAETGLPDVVTRPASERWLDLALVVDDGMSMLLWRRLAVELRALLQRAGAFRVVRVLGLHTRGAGPPLLRARPYDPDAPTLPVTAVSDPSGHTLVLVLSDGVGAAWRDGRMPAVLERWADQGPAAVLHALPPRLWEGSGIRAQRWQVRTRRPGSPGTDWAVADPVLPPELARFDGLPVPVLEPDAGPLADWARLIASPGGTAVLPLFAPPRPRRPAATPSVRSPAATPADELSRLRRFREAASPEAYRLAAHLAAVAPLPVPVMRLVQTAVAWQAETGHLAEVFLGGLMRPTEPPSSAGPGPFPPHHRPFTFTDPVRRALLGAVPARELDETRELIGTRLKELAGSSPDFPAWLAHPSGADRLPARARPFGVMDQRLATRLGAPPVARAAPLPAHRWRPLRPEDPRTIGPYTLRMTDPSGFRVTTYVGDEDAYGEQVVIHTALAANGPRAGDLLRVQAEALRRMNGRYAARLLRQDLDCATPWIAEEPFVAERLTHVPLRSDRDRAFAIGLRLADAVRVCAAEGMAHGDLRQSTVHVSDDGLFLTGWSTACIDGVPSPAHPSLAPTPQDNVHELAEILLDLGGGARFDDSRPPRPRLSLSHWRGPWRSVRDIVLAALAPDPRDRPTAQEMWECFERLAPDDPAQAGPPTRAGERAPATAPVRAAEPGRDPRPHGWAPLSDTDPQALGPYTLHCRVHARSGATGYLGRAAHSDEDAVVRTVDRKSGRRGSLARLRTEAEALRRMAGRYAPRLLGQDLDAEPPWTAQEHVLASDGSLARTLTALLSDGTARGWDARTAATIGRDLAEAVHVCTTVGMAHGGLTKDTVLVVGHSVKLVGWDSAVIDPSLWRRLGRGSPAEDVLALGEVLLALGGGRVTSRREVVGLADIPPGHPEFAIVRDVEWGASTVWRGETWRPVREVVTSCMDDRRRKRPTARGVADVFAQVLRRTAP
ncbi:SAV_2336 N-terminal domain-related protein [Streptomyces sparsogenes]|uniref:SAV_2336 N-terminal domain-related protein n=1 Tax=Streptomyces sparsogenes TaxID=67365 RepID=UPI0033C68D4B